jgi:hypothetical protein
MAFDFKSAASVKMKRKSPDTKKLTFEQAKIKSIGAAYDQQIKNYKDGKLNGKNGKPKPSNWMRKDEAGNEFISWRISNKPVYFTEDFVAEKGWMHSTNVLKDLADLKAMVSSGKYDAQLKEAYDRKPPPKASTEN